MSKIKINQTKTVDVDGWGNCVAACVATILGLRLEDIPEEDQKNFRYGIYDFVERLGYCIQYAETIEGIPDSVELFIAIGNGGRVYANGKPIKHAVVFDKNGLYHDPHASKQGIESAERFEYFVKLIGSSGRKG